MSAPQSVPAYLLVDGNNIIHAWPDLLALHRRRRGLGHGELCQRLRQFHDQSDYRVVVVFDGKGRKKVEEREPSGLQVIYTDGGSTADDVIERLVAKYAGTCRLVVATDDFAEQNLVAAMGAEVWSAKSLRAQVDANEGEWRRWV
ncbi:MAG: NYN domain-containing protein [Verrucomicrobiales bacterium]|nr:NYN domain-containing protein [Verrucomicrobiales bacterium]